MDKEHQQDILSSTDVTQDLIQAYLKSFNLENSLTNPEKEQLIQIATIYQLNPFKREIHCVVYGTGSFRHMNIIVGYEVYLKRAERTGKLDGWAATVEGEGETMKAVVEIHRKDWDHPFSHEVFWEEAVQKKHDGTITSFWKKMPKFQLRKVAISQAFRMCFPDELGGIPYDSAELPQEEDSHEREKTKENREKSGNQSKPAKSEPFEVYAEREGDKVSEELLFGPIPQITDSHRELAGLLDHHRACFTDKHFNWVINQIQTEPGENKVMTMLGYVRKVIHQNQNDKTA